MMWIFDNFYFEIFLILVGKPRVSMIFQACLACFEDPERAPEGNFYDTLPYANFFLLAWFR